MGFGQLLKAQRGEFHIFHADGTLFYDGQIIMLSHGEGIMWLFSTHFPVRNLGQWRLVLRGVGSLRYRDGSLYEGEFSHGVPHRTWPCHFQYVSEFGMHRISPAYHLQ